MKRISIIPFFAAALTGLSAAAVSLVSAPESAVTAQAHTSIYGVTQNGLEYNYMPNESEVTIIGYIGTSRDVDIPGPIEGRQVTAIQDYAFQRYQNGDYNPVNIRSVTIPSTVRTIGIHAFQRVPLEKLSIPAGVQTIGQEAFSECDSLTELKIYGKTTLETWAFDRCTNLKTVEIKDSSVIGDRVFTNCRNLDKVTIRKPSRLLENAFYNCEKLRSVEMSGSTIEGGGVFSYCAKLARLNGHDVIKYSTDGTGAQQPYFNANSEVRELIRYAFLKCSGVGFIDTYCTKLCEYVVATETDPWMSDMVKARQLHDWLIRSADYDPREDMDNPPYHRENHIASSVFVSYGLDGHGATVCEGFAKAYTMLLTKAEIESYVLWGKSRLTGKSNHVWNLVKVADRYYQCDVTWDNSQYDGGNSVMFGTNYKYFMKNNYDMHRLHRINGVQGYEDPTVNGYTERDHQLLVYNVEKGRTALAGSLNIPSVPDTNGDGIRDEDYDLDGRSGSEDYWDDMLARQQLAGTFYGYDVDINDKLSNVIYRQHLQYVVQAMLG